MSALNLSDRQLADLIKEVKAELVERLIKDHGDDLDLISPAQAAGILDVNNKTLADIPRHMLPRYVIVAGKVNKYRLSEVKAYLAMIREG